MRVHFWGTRGSIPAALAAHDVREKIVAALLAASGRTIDTLERAHAFYEKHGGKAVVISRFLPIVRTYIPFVAGLGAMQPGQFTLFNVVGAVLWVASLCYAGFFFGSTPWIKGNLTLIIVGIIVVSLLPLAWAWFKSRRAA